MALGQEMDRLRRLPIFACLDEDALRLIAFSAEPRHLTRGSVLFERGDAAESAVLLISGALTLDSGSSHGPVAVRAETGTLIDETALLAPALRTATAIAADSATVLMLARSSMTRVLDAYPHNAIALRRYWASRLAQRLGSIKAASGP